MSNTPKKLLAVVEFMEHARLHEIYKSLGFEVTVEWQVRKAVALVKKLKPDVIVADFYAQSDFRDRLSNLESLLAATQLLKDFKVLVYYEPHNLSALDRVRERLHIDLALPMPVSDQVIREAMDAWV